MEVEYIEYLASNSVADKKINLTSLHIHAFLDLWKCLEIKDMTKI